MKKSHTLDKSLRYIDMTMKMEGMPLSDSEKRTISDCLSGVKKTSDVIDEIVKRGRPRGQSAASALHLRLVNKRRDC
ncbi:MAG: hypothetical protein LBM59_04240 [Ruminococcus sp.]|jgi:hypothetical protein|nr:hypothetical protein [Ruminococcus sp.]